MKIKFQFEFVLICEIRVKNQNKKPTAKLGSGLVNSANEIKTQLPRRSAARS
jgi:hypothetical protein